MENCINCGEPMIRDIESEHSYIANGACSEECLSKVMAFCFSALMEMTPGELLETAEAVIDPSDTEGAFILNGLRADADADNHKMGWLFGVDTPQ